MRRQTSLTNAKTRQYRLLLLGVGGHRTPWSRFVGCRRQWRFTAPRPKPALPKSRLSHERTCPSAHGRARASPGRLREWGCAPHTHMPPPSAPRAPRLPRPSASSALVHAYPTASPIPRFHVPVPAHSSAVPPPVHLHPRAPSPCPLSQYHTSSSP